jgi:hypothetical protein
LKKLHKVLLAKIQHTKMAEIISAIFFIDFGLSNRIAAVEPDSVQIS